MKRLLIVTAMLSLVGGYSQAWAQLPHFNPGDVLRASDLNVMVNQINALSGSHTTIGAPVIKYFLFGSDDGQDPDPTHHCPIDLTKCPTIGGSGFYSPTVTIETPGGTVTLPTVSWTPTQVVVLSPDKLDLHVQFEHGAFRAWVTNAHGASSDPLDITAQGDNNAGQQSGVGPKIVALTVFGTGGTSDTTKATASGFVNGVCTIFFAPGLFSAPPHIQLTIYGFTDQQAQTLHLGFVTVNQAQILIGVGSNFCAGCSQNFELLAIGN